MAGVVSGDGAQPSADDQDGHGERPLRRRAQRPRQRGRGGQAQGATEPEAEQMGEEVRVRARAEESEQGETRRHDHQQFARGWAPSTGHNSRGREDSDGAEHYRGPGRRRPSARVVDREQTLVPHPPQHREVAGARLQLDHGTRPLHRAPPDETALIEVDKRDGIPTVHRE